MERSHPITWNGFKFSLESKGVTDIGKCSCGWQTVPYFDGKEYAYLDWKNHSRKKHDKTETIIINGPIAKDSK
jgi:hypothetical protein